MAIAVWVQSLPTFRFHLRQRSSRWQSIFFLFFFLVLWWKIYYHVSRIHPAPSVSSVVGSVFMDGTCVMARLVVCAFGRRKGSRTSCQLRKLWFNLIWSPFWFSLFFSVLLWLRIYIPFDWHFQLHVISFPATLQTVWQGIDSRRQSEQLDKMARYCNFFIFSAVQRILFCHVLLCGFLLFFYSGVFCIFFLCILFPIWLLECMWFSVVWCEA